MIGINNYVISDINCDIVESYKKQRRRYLKLYGFKKTDP